MSNKQLEAVKRQLEQYGIRDGKLYDRLKDRGYNPYNRHDIIMGGMEILQHES